MKTCETLIIWTGGFGALRKARRRKALLRHRLSGQLYHNGRKVIRRGKRMQPAQHHCIVGCQGKTMVILYPHGTPIKLQKCSFYLAFYLALLGWKKRAFNLR